jgi:hypothetical protein
MIATLGMLLITCLPTNLSSGRLVGYYLTQASPTPFVALLSLISTNVAGWTKKTTVAAMYLIGCKSLFSLFLTPFMLLHEHGPLASSATSPRNRTPHSYRHDIFIANTELGCLQTASATSSGHRCSKTRMPHSTVMPRSPSLFVTASACSIYCSSTSGARARTRRRLPYEPCRATKSSRVRNSSTSQIVKTRSLYTACEHASQVYRRYQALG